MAKSARERSTCAAGALGERLKRVNSLRSAAVSGRRDLSGGTTWDTSGHEDHRTTIPVPTADDPRGHSLVAAPHRRPTAPAHPPARLPTTQQLVKESCTVPATTRPHDASWPAFTSLPLSSGSI